MSHMTDTLPWLHRYFLLALQPIPRPPSLNACYLQVITPVTPRRQLTVFDGAHVAHAVLSHSAANSLDADAEDLGVTTRNLCGYLIAPVSVLVVPDLWAAVPEAVLVLQAVRVFADKCGRVPRLETLNRVDFAPEVLGALRANVGRKMASFITKDTLERPPQRGEADVKKALKESGEVRGIPPKSLEKDAHTLISLDPSGGVSTRADVTREKHAMADVDVRTAGSADAPAKTGEDEGNARTLEDADDHDWDINFMQAEGDEDAEIGDAEIDDALVGESLPLTQHYSCVEEEVEEVALEDGAKDCVTSDDLGESEKKKRTLDSMVNDYWETMHDDHSASAHDAAKNITKNSIAKSPPAIRRGHNAASDTPVAGAKTAEDHSSLLNNPSQSASLAKTMGDIKAKPLGAQGIASTNASTVPGKSATVQKVVVAKDIIAKESEETTEKNVDNTSQPAEITKAIRADDKAVEGAVTSDAGKQLESNIESAATRIDCQVPGGHVLKEQPTGSNGTKQQKEQKKGGGTSPTNGKSPTKKLAKKGDGKSAMDKDIVITDTKQQEHTERDEITPVVKDKVVDKVENRQVGADDIELFTKVGAKRKELGGSEDGTKKKLHTDPTQDGEKDAPVLQKLHNELEVVRQFRMAVGNDPVGYIYMPDAFLPSLSRGRGRKVRQVTSFPPPELEPKGGEKQPVVPDVPESAPI